MSPAHSVPDSESPLQAEAIHFAAAGPTAAPALVLLHGLDDSSAIFRPLFPDLARDYRVIACDQRGHGQTPERGMDYSTATLTGDLKALLDHLGVVQAHLMGHSLGARTAVRFAARHPDRVRSVVALDMEFLPRGEPLSPELLALAEEARRQFPAWCATEAELRQRLEPCFGIFAGYKILTHRVQRPDGKVGLSFHPHVSLLYGSQANAEDLGPALGQLQVPVLLLRADPDRGSAVTEAGLQHFRENTRLGESQLIENAGHYLHEDRPEKCLWLIRSFLRRVEKR